MISQRSAPTRRQLLIQTARIAAGLLAGTARSSAQIATQTPASPIQRISGVLGPQPLALEENGGTVSALTLPLNEQVTRNTPFDLAIRNETARPVMLDLGALSPPQADPLAALVRIAPGEVLNRRVSCPTAGTQLYDARLFGGDQPMPIGVFTSSNPDDKRIASSDHVLLIEDFRQAAEGTLLAPGQPGTVAKSTFTVNRQVTQEITLLQNRRHRLRFVNGCHRHAIALKIGGGYEATVIAIDGQPAEPFPARDGQLILAPGTRIDVTVDSWKKEIAGRAPVLLHDGRSARPIVWLIRGQQPANLLAYDSAAKMASNGLPERIDLKSALRIDLAMGAAAHGKPPDWQEPAAFESRRPAPAFSVRRGRAVVLTLVNRHDIPATFRLHGHHFRLLDRLDDGWKPFWQDRLLFQPGETHRIAFQPNDAGGFLLEAMAMDWSAPKLIRWFRVE